MPWPITKPRSAWLAQAREAWTALAPQAPPGAHRRALAAIDHENFARLIEALTALKPGEVSQELQNLAGLRPVGEVLGMPDDADDADDADDVEKW